jgi:hypothetical protein
MQKNEMAQRLTSLNERERKTQDEEIRIRAQAENIQTQLETAQREAREKFGTDDLTELRQKYSKARDEDLRAMGEYEETLKTREEILDAISHNLDTLRLN